MSDIALREATVADAGMLLQVLQTAFAEYREQLDPPSGVHRETVETLREKMRTTQWLIALEGEQAVGCVMCEPREDYLYLGRLAVLPAFRRRGIGKTLIEYVEAHARAEGFSRVRLGVRLALPHLRARYERIGYQFVEAHTHAGYTEPTYVILEKTLTSPSPLCASTENIDIV